MGRLNTPEHELHRAEILSYGTGTTDDLQRRIAYLEELLERAGEDYAELDSTLWDVERELKAEREMTARLLAKLERVS